jgi:hypothetical protein
MIGVLLFLVGASFAQYPACVIQVITDLNNKNPAALTVLNDCFTSIAFTYNPMNCMINSTIGTYCNASSECVDTITYAIQLAYKYNCSEETVAALAASSPFICVPGNGSDAHACPDGNACVPVPGMNGSYACLPIYDTPSMNCSYQNAGQPCSPCPYSTVCAVDFQNNMMPTCVMALFRLVDIVTDPLPDAYFYLGQTICQKNSDKFCSDLIWKTPQPNCTDVATWGCCASSYLELADNCINPSNDLIDTVNGLCPDVTTWTASKCKGVSAKSCCGAVSSPCNLNGASGLLPSVLVLLLAQIALYIS